MTADRFLIRTLYSPIVTRYEVWNANSDWSSAQQLSDAEGKLVRAGGEIVFYSDASKSTVLFRFTGRIQADGFTTFEVTDADGVVLGSFGKKWDTWSFNAPWFVHHPGLPQASGKDKSTLAAVLRSTTNPYLAPLTYAFEADGAPAFEVARKGGLKNPYRVSVLDKRYDVRFVQAVAVGLDALQNW